MLHLNRNGSAAHPPCGWAAYRKIEYSLHNEHHMLTLHITIKARSMLAIKMAPGGSGTLPDSQHRRPSKGAGYEFLMRDRARNKGCSREEIQRMYNQFARARKL